MSATDGAVWTVQELSAEGPGFTWPHGTRELIAERKRVQEMQVLQRQIAHGAFYNRTDPGIFKCPLSYEEAFVGSDTARIGLMDRLRMHYNSEWKCDVKDARAGRALHGLRAADAVHAGREGRVVTVGSGLTLMMYKSIHI
jgi:hypothetical protein